MTLIAKILASIGIFLLYGFMNQAFLMSQGRTQGPNGVGIVFGLALIAGLVAIWKNKSPKQSDSDKLDKSAK